MVLWVKTTLEIEDSLLIAAKKRAAELRRPLRLLVEAGLRQQISGTKRPSRPKAAKIQWVTVPGGLSVDVSSRESLHAWLNRSPR